MKSSNKKKKPASEKSRLESKIRRLMLKVRKLEEELRWIGDREAYWELRVEAAKTAYPHPSALEAVLTDVRQFAEKYPTLQSLPCDLDRLASGEVPAIHFLCREVCKFICAKRGMNLLTP